MKTDVLLIPFGATWAQLRGGGAAGPEAVPECWTALTALAGRLGDGFNAPAGHPCSAASPAPRRGASGSRVSVSIV